MTAQVDEVVITGTTQDGRRFRPSDWAERLCGVLSVFGAEKRMEYSPYVQPITVAGVKCVVVNRKLEAVEPMAFKFLMSFAQDNELQVRPGRGDSRRDAAPADGAAGNKKGGD